MIAQPPALERPEEASHATRRTAPRHLHHGRCACGTVDFYTRVLGLRLVKKTVNQDDPTVYHLFFADEQGSAGSDITFFEYRGARPGRAGAGMVHRVVWRLASHEALDFWEKRLSQRRGRERTSGALSAPARP